MRVFNGAAFTEEKPWHGPDVATIGNVAVKLRWTDKPYVWHTNSGEEVFAVLDGIVHMLVRENGAQRIIELRAGDVLHVQAGDEHVAHPQGAARILVVEQMDSD